METLPRARWVRDYDHTKPKRLVASIRVPSVAILPPQPGLPSAAGSRLERDTGAQGHKPAGKQGRVKHILSVLGPGVITGASE